MNYSGANNKGKEASIYQKDSIVFDISKKTSWLLDIIMGPFQIRYL